MDRRGVNVILNTLATPTMIAEMGADAVIMATGATPRMDGRVNAKPDHEVDGTNQDHVVSTQQLLTGHHNQIGKSAVVLDDVGAYEAIGAAEFLVKSGAHVTFVTTHPMFAPRMIPAGLTVPAMERLTEDGRFQLMTRAYIDRIDENTVEVGSLDGWATTKVDAETVVLVTLNEPQTQMVEELEAHGIDVQVVGDAGGPEFLPNAFAKGHMAARNL